VFVFVFAFACRSAGAGEAYSSCSMRTSETETQRLCCTLRSMQVYLVFGLRARAFGAHTHKCIGYLRGVPEPDERELCVRLGVGSAGGCRRRRGELHENGLEVLHKCLGARHAGLRV
jgi:hypothetical protein